MINIDYKDMVNFYIDGTLAEVGVEMKFLFQCYIKRLIHQGVVDNEVDAGGFIKRVVDKTIEEMKEREEKENDIKTGSL